MKIGQMSVRGKISELADYLQLDISGLSLELTIDKYMRYYHLNNKKPIPVILHGDWQKNGASENNILERLYDYIDIFNELKLVTEVIGITIHPPFRKKVLWNEFLDACDLLEANGLEVFVENRSNSKIYLSTPDEILEFSKKRNMTIDIPQLFISCGYDNIKMKEALEQLNKQKIKEVHLANLKRDGSHTYVGRKVSDGSISIENIFKLLTQDRYITLEILGGNAMFKEQLEIIEKHIQK